MNDEISSADRLFNGNGAGPLRREEQFVSTPERDSDRIVGARFTLIGERNLQCQITTQRDRVKRIRDVGQSGLGTEVRETEASRARRTSARAAACSLQCDPQRINRVALDLVGPATGAEMIVRVALEVFQVLAVVLHVEPEIASAILRRLRRCRRTSQSRDNRRR